VEIYENWVRIRTDERSSRVHLRSIDDRQSCYDDRQSCYDDRQS
jgi:hypothetical protein